MNNEELINWFDGLKADSRYVEIDNQMLDMLGESGAKHIAEYFGHNTMIKLPKNEIKFFEWMKKYDYAAWDDLWNGQDEEAYIVAAGFLPNLLDKHRGFPICDLIEVDNYYFTDRHIAGTETKLLLETIKQMFLEKKHLTTAQLLLLEISLTPIDIWHFAYKHKVDLKAAKDAVRELVDENMLIHLTSAEHLAVFI